MIQKEINLREERDFGQKFNAVFTFIQLNFKSLLKVILLLVGPLVLIGGLFFGMFFSKIFDTAFTNEVQMDMFFDMCVMYLALSLSSIWLQIVVYSYMAEYLSGNREIDVTAVWQRAKGKILRSLGAVFIIGIIVMIGMIFFIIPGIYLAVVLLFTFPIIIIENRGVFESISRCFSLIQGKWWSTFGLLVIVSMVANTVTSVLSIPLIVSVFIGAVLQFNDTSQIFVVISSVIMFLGSYIMASLPLLASGFQYFNLVERKEGTGLLEKIDQIGKTVSPNEGDY